MAAIAAPTAPQPRPPTAMPVPPAEPQSSPAASVVPVAWMVANLVHFSFKAVNSVIHPGGVRLGRQSPSGFPHVHVKALLGEGVQVPLDYMSDAARNARPFAAYRIAMGEVSPSHTQAGPGTRNPCAGTLAASDALLDHPMQSGTERISPRHRQLLIPDGEGGYLTISPLPCSGLSELIETHVQQRWADIKAFKAARAAAPAPDEVRPRAFPRAAAFSVGGSNPQNVGGRMRTMRPLLAPAWPVTSPEERAAWRLYHEGFVPRLPRAAVHHYAAWLIAHRQSGRAWSVAVREAEHHALAAAWNAVLSQASIQRRLLAEWPAVFAADGQEPTLHPSRMTDWNRGWLLGEVTPRWRAGTGMWFARELERYAIGKTPKGDAARMGMTSDDVGRIAGLFSRAKEYVA